MRASGHSWKFQRVCLITLTMGVLCSPSPAYAQAPAGDNFVTGTTDWDQWKDNCSLATDFRKKFFNCASSTFRSRPFHFLVQSIVPGSGVGGGGRYSVQSGRHSDGVQSPGPPGCL